VGEHQVQAFFECARGGAEEGGARAVGGVFVVGLGVVEARQVFFSFGMLAMIFIGAIPSRAE
jgi:hypothetical protein